MQSPSHPTTKPQVEVRYCLGCGYFPQASWITNEFWSEFSGTVGLTLTPVEGGRLEVLLDGEILFDRVAQGGEFPTWNSIRQMRRAVRKKLSGAVLASSESAV